MDRTETRIRPPLLPGGMLAITLLSVLLTGYSFAAGGRITGKVVDAKTGEALLGANVVVQGTAMGASTNVDGEFVIPSVPEGSHTVAVTYLGYKRATFPVQIVVDSTVRLNARLQFDIVQLGEVVVTAQLEGQVQAINQQLTSNTIVNVVSADRIRELPDQNAAESIARLPGISIQRDAGEGQKVVVRGLAPKFSLITVNGERIPSTDANDRSVDLSMISSDLLSGIEVFKALTPDKDGDAVGGTVNLVLREAPAGVRGDLRVQGGYNHMRKEYGQYRTSLSLSNRFFDDALGIVVTGSVQRANRSSDRLTADYLFGGTSSVPGQPSIINIENLNLAYLSEIRERFGGGLTMDYKLDNGGLFMNAFISQTDRDRARMRKRYRVGSFTTEFDMQDQKQSTGLLSTSLSGNHRFDWFEVDWRAGFSRTKQFYPYSLYSRFQEVGAYNDGLIDNRGPEIIPSFARNDLSATWFQYGTYNPDDVLDKDLSGQLNLTVPYRIGEDIAGTVKFGGKYRGKNREHDATEYRTPFAEIDRIGQANPDRFALYRGQNVLIGNFADPSFHADNFLDDRYSLNFGLSRQLLEDFYAAYRSHYQLNRFLELQDYSASEHVAAGYLMTELNVGSGITFLPGFRYERTTTDYHGKSGFLQGNLGEIGTIRDTVGGQAYDDFLPMVQLRYRFTPWLDLRLAYTRSLSRPDYFNLVPFEQITFAEQTIVRGNPTLRRTRATSYDAYLSFYNNDIGLITLGGYYKKLKDIDYVKQTRIVGGQYNAFELTEPVNGEDSDVWGIEIDLQTNLRNLPSPFDGFVINANYSYIRSETFFPYFEIGPRSPDPPYRPTIIDTFRKGTLPGQANYIGNISLGYEVGGFSGRVSVTFQGKTLQTVGARAELDGYTNSFVRWDASFSQKLSSMFSLFLDVNNISNQPDQSYLGDVAYPTNQEYYGWTADLGVRMRF